MTEPPLSLSELAEWSLCRAWREGRRPQKGHSSKPQGQQNACRGRGDLHSLVLDDDPLIVFVIWFMLCVRAGQLCEATYALLLYRHDPSLGPLHAGSTT